MAIIRINSNDYQKGESYIARVQRETDRNFEILLNLLSSYWQSTIDGPNYANHLKAMSIALAEVKVSLEDILLDNRFTLTRGEFLYQIVTSMVFPYKDGFPDLNTTDVDFRTFLIEIIKIYFKGSIPDSIKEAAELIFSSTIVVKENFIEARNPSSGFDISDQFGFTIDVMIDSLNDIDIFRSDKNIRLMLKFIRPSHTLYKIKYILSESYIGNKNNGKQTPGKEKAIIDENHMDMSSYDYEDFRKFTSGVSKIDEKGTKVPIIVIGEIHSGSEFY